MGNVAPSVINKILTLGKLQINLHFRSLIRIFAEKYWNEKKDLFMSGSYE